MPIPNKTCKCCGHEHPIVFFKPHWLGEDFRHSFCSYCTTALRYNQVVRWNHYFNPNLKPTKGYNPYNV